MHDPHDTANPSVTHSIQRGVQQHRTGRLAEAVQSYQEALVMDPTQADAHHLLGVIAFQTGQHDRAVEWMQKAVSLNPALKDAYNNLAQVYRALGQMDRVADCLRQVVTLDPNHAQAHVNLGTVCQTLGRKDDAITCYQRALYLQPDDPETVQNFSRLMRNRTFMQKAPSNTEDLKALLLTCLSQKDVQHQDLACAGWDLLIDDSIVQTMDSPCPLDNAALMSLYQDELFLRLLEQTLITNPQLEDFLTNTRKAIALRLVSGGLDDQTAERLTPLAVALAHQCFWNEYVFCQSNEEARAIETLLARSLRSPDSLAIALLACYARLDSYHLNLDTVSLPGLIKIQGEQPRRERQLAQGIDRLRPIEDEVSREVMQQYEENPYPRWRGLYRSEAIPFSQYLRMDIYPNTSADLPDIEAPDVLIAGCGTGSHPISCAQAYREARILGVDLSLASLSYAKRKAEEANASNLQFMQADILDLPKLDRTFDVIECAGVLHHMAEPILGWKTLLKLLKPDGVMKIGLYSEQARQYVVAARDFIASQGYDGTAQGIRACRQAIFDLPDDHLAKQACLHKDFYTTSAARDLLFHVQEHRFTLPQLAQILDDLDLTLLGFVLDRDTKQDYLSQCPQDPSATSLTHWHRYETDHPNTFSGMYKFWVQMK